MTSGGSWGCCPPPGGALGIAGGGAGGASGVSKVFASGRNLSARYCEIT
jgi:hypothetical protein